MLASKCAASTTLSYYQLPNAFMAMKAYTAVPSTVAVADFDNDGFLDVVRAVVLLSYAQLSHFSFAGSLQWWRIA